MHIERHVFGSVTGYATLACSAGLSNDERQQLESASFGTPYEPSYQASLTQRVACWSRPLRSGRRAVSRVLPGRPDDAGRPTLLFVTAVVAPEDWDFTLQGDVRPLLRRGELWKWDGAPDLTALDLPGLDPGPLRLSTDTAQRALGLVSLIELSWADRQPVIVRAEHYSLDDVALVERLLPAAIRRDYSAVYRGLNPDLAASLNCLAEGVPADTSNPARRLNTAKSPYALRLASEGLAAGRTPEVLLVGCDDFGRPRIDTRAPHPEDHAVEPYAEHAPADTRRAGTVQISTALLAALLLLVLLIGGTVGWAARAAGRPRPPTALAPPPWEHLLSEALALPTQDHAAQLRTLGELQDRLGAPPFAEAAPSDELAETLARLQQTVQLTRAAEQAIAEVEPDDRRSIRAADQALAALGQHSPDAAAALDDWFAARQRPSADTLALLSRRLEEKVAPQIEALETRAERIDQRALRQAGELRAALNLLEAVTMDRPLPWISDCLARLDRIIAEWEATLDTLERQKQQDTQQETSRVVESRERLGQRLTELSAALAESDTRAADRERIGAALQEIARAGQAGMGNVFARPIGQLADWILTLQDVAPPEHLAAINLAIDNCRATARTIERAARRLSRDNSSEQNDKILSDVRTEARTLILQFSRLQDLVGKIADEPAAPSDEWP
jgi:hypothetical protein